MNAKDREMMDTAIAELKVAFDKALKDALLPHIVANTALEQRSTNFAARVSANMKIMHDEIAYLREQVAALTPKPATPLLPRLSDAEWRAATDALKLKHPGVTFFTPAVIRQMDKELKAKPVVAPVASVVETEYDDEAAF